MSICIDLDANNHNHCFFLSASSQGDSMMEVIKFLDEHLDVDQYDILFRL